ncbi:MAG: hypothetical protein M3R38_25155, partial [Actinomycetota bacterium]|nr:hypothetical protein [Actinomycetota bacterium]
ILPHPEHGDLPPCDSGIKSGKPCPRPATTHYGYAYYCDEHYAWVEARAQGAGRAGLRRLVGDPRALVEAAPRDRGRDPEAFAGQDAEHLADPRGKACPVAPARRALCAVEARARRMRLGGDDEPGDPPARVDLQKRRWRPPSGTKKPEHAGASG